MDTTDKPDVNVRNEIDRRPEELEFVPTAPGTVDIEELEGAQSVSPLQAAVRRFWADKRAVFFLGVVLFILLGSYIFPVIYTHIGPTIKGGITGTQNIQPTAYHDPYQIDLLRSDIPGTFLPLGPQSLVHPLGTDAIGRDIFARLMAGVNISIEVALMVEVFDIGLGILLGTLAGWFGGWLGMVLDRFTDIVFAFPGLLLILLIGAAVGPIFDVLFKGQSNIFGRMLMLALAIGLLSWPLMMRYVRGTTLEMKERQFIEAARTVGTSTSNILTKHIVPNLFSIVVVASTLNILGTIIGEAGISLLGAGLKPPAASLGLMIADATSKIYTSSTELIWPCVLLVILVIAFSFVGDGVNDAFNPRKKD
jgi:ABC-type dipeptide/oligopeptide/nickel transport system permease subunit